MKPSNEFSRLSSRLSLWTNHRSCILVHWIRILQCYYNWNHNSFSIIYLMLKANRWKIDEKLIGIEQKTVSLKCVGEHWYQQYRLNPLWILMNYFPRIYRVFLPWKEYLYLLNLEYNIYWNILWCVSASMTYAFDVYQTVHVIFIHFLWQYINSYDLLFSFMRTEKKVVCSLHLYSSFFFGFQST